MEAGAVQQQDLDGAVSGHQVIRSLSFDIIKISDWTPIRARSSKQGWIAVALADGQRGHVAEEYIRSPVDYRAIFNKEDGKWLMTAFVAGD